MDPAGAAVMTALPEHPVSHRIALFGLCGDLVVAIDVMAIREIRTVEDTALRPSRHGRLVLELDGEHGGALVPGWDLGELLGIDAAPVSWVIVELPGSRRRVALRLGRCVTVQPLPVCRSIPRGIFASRPRAIAAGFSTAAIPELSAHVSGVVLDLRGVLGGAELDALARLEEGREAALEA
jgi:hypothetical protein